jgi:hypothetical protein
MSKYERYTRQELQYLKQRWAEFSEAIRILPNVIRIDPNWDESEEYRSLMLSVDPLPSGLKSMERDLRGIQLKGCDLSGADLRDVDLSGADLNGANLANVNLWGCSLFEADLSDADLTDANLSGANLEGANLSGARLKGSHLQGVSYTTDTLFDRLMGYWIPIVTRYIPLIKRKVWPSCRPTDFEYIDTTILDSSQNPLLRRYIEDYQYIKAFRYKSWFRRTIVYPIWKVSSDCGRSLLAWSVCSIAIALLFGLIYAPFTMPSQTPGILQDILSWADPEIYIDSNTHDHPIWTPIYFSIVTFTTLGFGDIQPRNGAGLFWVGLEVIIGYIMLGGLVSIFASKLARRA